MVCKADSGSGIAEIRADCTFETSEAEYAPPFPSSEATSVVSHDWKY